MAVDVSPSPRVTDLLAALETFISADVKPLERELAASLASSPATGVDPSLNADGTLSRTVWDARREVARRSAAAGFYNLHLPVEVGGGGLSRTEMFFVEEAVYHHGLGLSPAVLAWTEGPSPALLYLDAGQQERFLEPLMRGETTGAFANTEPGAGSDVLGIQTRAVRDGGDWVISGRKAWITNSTYCDVAQITAVTDPGAGTRSLTFFLVEADRPGFRRGANYPTIMDDGLTGELIFDAVRIPDANRVGEVGQGFPLAMTWINWRRMCRGGMCSGWSRLLLDRAVRRARSRQTSAGPIADLQAVQHMVADMYADWYAARATSLHAQAELDALGPYDVPLHPDAVPLMSLVKLVNDESFFRVADRAVQLHGASGLTKNSVEEKLFRIARNLRIPAGTVEIQRNGIARSLLRG